ncbi:acyl-CoA dehydrogenase family protein [Chitinophaga qingshengii]|uniref:Acyl-CoA/acyl-ACP dehydrogenase n=1 Tax=Chitinophaga qingshengii TaxID=1569794 RepID=A0ABR7TUP7_9BACT|nr:acyl-CoA dehydrogenase family protein [Chitinophaga qingshengii]MBC9932694.1 acyl-CoA/acyl-ACP dehydrogenase [Chitinophaga qingshengii]
MKQTPFLEQVCEHFSAFDYRHYTQGNISKAWWEKLVTAGIYQPVIRRSDDGRENYEELSRMIAQAAYHNLGLAMSFIVSTLLFADNVMEYGTEALKKEVLADLSDHAGLGGIAIIEPEVGSGLRLMQTVAEKEGDGFRIKGKKHWQCFSTSAGWWLVTAKNKGQDETAGAFGFYVHKSAAGGFRTAQTYQPKGLHVIDFGVNELDAYVPDYRRLNLCGTGIPEIYQLIIPTWRQFASLGNGFLSRMYEESVKFASERPCPAGYLKDIAFVRYRLGNIAACRTICQALFHYVIDFFRNNEKGTREIFPAQCIKVMASDCMLSGAMHYQILCGANGYRYDASDNIAAMAVNDAQAFVMLSIPNDVLSLYLANEFLEKFGREGHTTFRDLITHSPFTQAAAAHLEPYKKELAYMPAGNLELVMSGQILTRIFAIAALDQYSSTAEADPESISAAILYCVNEIATILGNKSIAQQISNVI